MKLKNKKTGEIKELQEIMHEAFCEHNEKSLMNLEKEWEDYEEPETFWYITAWGDVKEYSQDQFAVKQKQAIGNYFETEEEAEKAVEKLKAWKRLKDKGFRFDGYDVAHKSNGNLAGQIFYDAGNYSIEDVEKEMDLIFGGEDE